MHKLRRGVSMEHESCQRAIGFSCCSCKHGVSMRWLCGVYKEASMFFLPIITNSRGSIVLMLSI